jgi:hypothetical protein
MATYTREQVYNALGLTDDEGNVDLTQKNADAETYLLLQEIRDILTQIRDK